MEPALILVLRALAYAHTRRACARPPFSPFFATLIYLFFIQRLFP